MDNNVTISGNTTREPELRFTPSGTAIASFGVAVNKSRKNAAGGWDNEAMFFDVTLFGDLAEHAAESVAKGQRVIVSGRLEQSSWQTETGDNRSKVGLVGNDLGLSVRWGAITGSAPTSTAAKVDRAVAGAVAYNPAEEPF